MDSVFEKRCYALCKEFPEVFKEELGVLKRIELEIQLKAETFLRAQTGVVCTA